MASVERLERVLVAKWILFKKVTIRSKGESPKVRGTVCNIPIENAVDNYNVLLRPTERYRVSIVKLKITVQSSCYIWVSQTISSEKLIALPEREQFSV